MLGQETRDFSVIIVQQRYKSSFMIFVWSFEARQTKWEILFGLCAITHPPTLMVRKMFGYVDLKVI